MSSDDLNAPLGQNKRKQPSRWLAAAPQILAGGLGLFAIAVAGWAIFGNDPLGGEPTAVVAVTPPAKAPAKPPGDGQQHSHHDGTPPEAAPPVKVVTPTPVVPPGSKTITIIDGSSGNRQNIIVPDPDKASDTAPKAQAEQHVLENASQGAAPKIAADSARPFRMFAHPRKLPADKTDAPRIAVIVGGLGISATGTADALAKLPAPVTLAFSPYGADLDNLTKQAQAADHEVLLQTPMEPFDYPDNDPGPQTLLTSLTPEQNIDRLHWQMSRLKGYVGVVSYMGARFTASEPALSPVLREIAKRGLIYLDDGASPRSVAGQIAGGHSFPFAKTDVVIDLVPTPGEIDQALARLELSAREHGSAVGLATALPATVTRIAEWARTVEARGFVLVPITMVAVKDKSS